MAYLFYAFSGNTELITNCPKISLLPPTLRYFSEIAIYLISLNAMQKITVLLPVKNGEPYISDAINSILNQSHTDFELLIFNDNSTDHTLQTLEAYNDSRIKIFNTTDGFIANLNKGLDLAKGEYIARMDADDIMHPERLKLQLEVMETTDTDICSSWLNVFGVGIDDYVSNHGLQGRIDNPLEKFCIGNFVAHPSVMIRKAFLIKHNLHYANYPHVEDFRLWTEIAKKNGVFYVDSRLLLNYRLSANQVTNRHLREMEQQDNILRQEIAEYLTLQSNT